MTKLYIKKKSTTTTVESNSIAKETAEVRSNKSNRQGKRGTDWIKPDSFYKEISHWRRVNDMDEDCDFCYIPLDKTLGGGKSPISYKILKPQSNSGQNYITQSNWNWKEANALMRGTLDRPIPIETCDSNFGIMISGKCGVLDFDCEADWRWFVNEFKFNPESYMVVRGKMNGSHSCECKSDCVYGYHIYFKISESFDKFGQIKCIFNDEFTKRRNIDLLKEARTGTPHIVKTPSGMDGDAKEWVNQEVDCIRELPDDVVKYFKEHWYSKKEVDIDFVIKDNTSEKLIKYLRQLPRNYVFCQKKYYNVLRCLRANAVPYEEIFRWSNELKQSNSKDNEMVHSIYLKQLWANMSGERNFKDYQLIRNIVEEENSDGFHKIHNQYLAVNERFFSRKKLIDIKTSNLTLNDKLSMVRAVYNRFFVYIVDSEPTVYMLEYSENGTATTNMVKGEPCRQKESYGVMMSMKKDDPKEFNTYQWWLNQVGGNEYSRIEFEPYGIKSRPSNDYNTYNKFNGYEQKFDKNYNMVNHPDNHLGDTIEKHMRVAMTSNNPIYLIGLKAWMYTIIVKGERTNVAVLFYSKINGAGKSWIWETFGEYVMGLTYVHKTANISSSLSGQFTIGEDKSLILIEELPQYRFDGKNGSNEVDCALKSMITDTIQKSEKKFKDEKQVKSTVNVMAFTNNLKCVNPEMAQRRLMMFILNHCFVNDTEHWSACALAFTKKGWTNWVHRYLVNDDSLASIQVRGTSTFLDKYADTDLRKMTLDRSLNSMVYWIKDLLEEIKSLADEGQEDVYSHYVGQHRPINDYYDEDVSDSKGIFKRGLFNQYNDYCDRNGMYKICKHSKNFEEALKTTFEIQTSNLIVRQYNTEEQSLSALKTKNIHLNVIKVNGKGKGNDGKSYVKKAYRTYIIFTAELLIKLDTMIRDSERQQSNLVEMTQQEFEEGMKNIVSSESHTIEPEMNDW